MSKGSKNPEYIDEVVLCKSNPLETNLYYVKDLSKGRTALNKDKTRKIGNSSAEYAKGAKEAWVLATSLPHQKYLSAKRIVNLFRTRMQIEEGFRDLKSRKYGFSLKDAYSGIIHRIEILLLIAMIGSLIAWLVGFIAEGKKLQYQFQANSIKTHRVLSLFFLGCQVLRRKIHISFKELEIALSSIQYHAAMKL